jgi:heme-degrading monooxygenase HmoA
MFVVLVTFEPDDAQADGNFDAVHAILDDLVRHQPGFLRARVHKGQSSGGAPRVVNYMEWDSEAAFKAFRSAHGTAVTERIGPFDPQFTFLGTMADVQAVAPV